MERFVLALRRAVVEHFKNVSDRFETFVREQRQVEGWFKGELHFLFKKLPPAKLEKFRSEVRVPPGVKKNFMLLDFELEFPHHKQAVVERKHVILRAGQRDWPPYRPEHKRASSAWENSRDYFAREEFRTDTKKLLRAKIETERHFMPIFTPAPTVDDWERSQRTIAQSTPDVQVVTRDVDALGDETALVAGTDDDLDGVLRSHSIARADA